MTMVIRRIARVGSAVGVALLRHPVHFLKYLARQVAAYERYRLLGEGEADRNVDSVGGDRLTPFRNSPPTKLLPQRSLDEICGAGTRLAKDWRPDAPDKVELPEPEQRALARIVAARRPVFLFEIDTYRGGTTRLLAACAPSSVVHTLDLSPEHMLEGGCFRKRDSALIGTRFKGDLQTRSRITQHFGDSREFDFSPFYGHMDLVFVDASHAYEAVLNDSHAALQMVRNDGIVVWDDYDPIRGVGVMKALADISVEREVVWIRGTRLAIYLADAKQGNDVPGGSSC